jgi:23S rRNA (cytidine1920-2'-O)/16S rRNA (cytidine1409-2'-O)-methyltransferase
MALVKKRFDVVVGERYPLYSRQQIQSWIMQGKILVDGQQQTKPGVLVLEDVLLTMNIEEPKYVGRAGFKLEKALEHFALNVEGLVILDAGLSTGGFTDCLLQRGAKKVYGIDVGYGQVHEKIAQDDRVIVRERTNLRDLTDLEELVDMVTLDLSFISVLKVMDAVRALLKPGGTLVILIKPQFESERKDVGRGGIIKDPAVHQAAIKKVVDGVGYYGFAFKGVVDSPIEGAMGNKEFLAYFVRNLAS